MIKKVDKSKLTGTNDVIFKAIMYENMDILEAILNTILPFNLHKLKYRGQELPVVQFIEKGKRLDVLAENIDSILDIEVSKNFNKYIGNRNYAFGASLYSRSAKRSGSYREYKHTYIINIIDGIKGKYGFEFGKNCNQCGYEMTNMLTEMKLYLDYYYKKYYNNNDTENINKYKYLIMLKLNLEQLKKFNERFGDDIVSKYVKKFEDVVNDDDIVPLYTREENYIMEKNTEREIGIEIGEKRGERNKTIELAKNFKMQGVPLDSISRATGLSLKKVMML